MSEQLGSLATDSLPHPARGGAGIYACDIAVEKLGFSPCWEKPAAKSPLNKINPQLNFMRFFKTLLYFVASAFAARL